MRVAMRYMYVATRYIRVRNGITSPILITSMSRNRCGSAEIDQDCSEIVARLCCFPESSFRVTDLPFLDAGPCLLWSLIANPVGSIWIFLSCFFRGPAPGRTPERGGLVVRGSGALDHTFLKHCPPQLSRGRQGPPHMFSWPMRTASASPLLHPRRHPQVDYAPGFVSLLGGQGPGLGVQVLFYSHV